MKRANIAVLVSGGGTNLQALIDAEKKGIIKSGKIELVISSKPGVFALERAQKAGIKTQVSFLEKTFERSFSSSAAAAVEVRTMSPKS